MASQRIASQRIASQRMLSRLGRKKVPTGWHATLARWRVRGRVARSESRVRSSRVRSWQDKAKVRRGLSPTAHMRRPVLKGIQRDKEERLGLRRLRRAARG